MARSLGDARYRRVTRAHVLASPLHGERPVQWSKTLLGVVVAYLAGCYEPELRDCTVHCTSASDCTGGQVCRKDGWCAMPEITKCPKADHDETESNPDAAAVAPDAPPSPTVCEQGCTNGSCEDGVCVIDCSTAYACSSDVTCPANLPCRVVCGDHACAKKVNCGMATSCDVQCTGDDACADDIQCNMGRCKIDCAGESSCKKKLKCDHACACDVTCSGLGSCAEPAACPAPSCKLGNGCSSLLAGCDRC